MELRSVSKWYGSTQALDDYSLRVPSGTVTGFVGQNGAGKSTALKLLAGLRPADRGEITLDGRPLSPQDRGRIGFMPEERGLYVEEKVGAQMVYFAEILGMSRAHARDEVARLAKSVGLDELLAMRFGSLSLGNRQRAQIVLALLNDPAFLLLDEPFSGLDPMGVADIGQLIRGLANNGVGILLSSHQLDLVGDVSDRVAVIEEGRSRGEGDIVDVLGLAAPAWKVAVDADDSNIDAVTAVLATFGPTTRRGNLLTTELFSSDDDGALVRMLIAVGPVSRIRSVDSQRASLRELLQHGREKTPA